MSNGVVRHAAECRTSLAPCPMRSFAFVNCFPFGVKPWAHPSNVVRMSPPRFRRPRSRALPSVIAMSAPYGTPEFWDETAPSMLDFALSGPGWAAAGLFVVAAVGICVALFDVGPRKGADRASGSLFYLRVTVSKPLRVELPSGVIADLSANDETLLRESKFETADALSRTIASAAERASANLSYTLYRVDGDRFVPIRQFPRELNAEGAPGWVDSKRAVTGSGEARWTEYEQLGAFDSVEDEWKSVVKNLGGVVRETRESIAKDACKLCNGSGRRKCQKCMGVSAGAGGHCKFCRDGQIECEWCDGAGRAS